MHRSGTIQAEAIDNLVGNAEIPGRWIFRLENSNGEEDSDLKCLRWYAKERRYVFGYSREPDPCPCTGVQGYFDDRYEWVEADIPFSYCFYTKFPRQGRGRKCCYYTTLDKLAALIIGFPGGGSLHRYHSLTTSLKEQHEASDLNGFRHCCLEAKNSFSCNKYYELRPSKGCDGYEPPVWSKFLLLLLLLFISLFSFIPIPFHLLEYGQPLFLVHILFAATFGKSISIIFTAFNEPLSR